MQTPFSENHLQDRGWSAHAVCRQLFQHPMEHPRRPSVGRQVQPAAPRTSTSAPVHLGSPPPGTCHGKTLVAICKTYLLMNQQSPACLFRTCCSSVSKTHREESAAARKGMGACTAAAVKIRKHAHDCPIHSCTVPSMLALTKYNAVPPPPLAGCCTEHVTRCIVQACLQKGKRSTGCNHEHAAPHWGCHQRPLPNATPMYPPPVPQCS